jgi:uncharacterized membrane protein
MRKALKELLSDATGTLSAMRVMGLCVVGTVLGILIAQNVAGLIAGKGFIDLPVNCLGALVAVIGGKVAQNWTEPKGPSPT